MLGKDELGSHWSFGSSHKVDLLLEVEPRSGLTLAGWLELLWFQHRREPMVVCPKVLRMECSAVLDRIAYFLSRRCDFSEAEDEQEDLPQVPSD